MGTRWSCQRQGYGTTLWEDNDLAEKLKLNKLNQFGGTVWSRSVETSYEEYWECVIEDVPLVVGTGAVELDGGKAKRPGVFLEVLRVS